MKTKFLLYIVLMIIGASLGCDLTSTNDTESDPNPTETPTYEARLLSYSIVKDGVEYPMNAGASIIDGEMPYKTDITGMVAKFTLSEGAAVYVGDVEQISGVTVNDFSHYFEYRVVSKDGQKENLFAVYIKAAKNTEAKLYSMSVLVGSTPYPCTIASSTITVDFPDKYKADLFNVILNFVISEDATIHDGVWPTSLQNGGTFNIGSYIGSIWFRVKAQNTAYYADYDMNVTCINCNL